MKHNWKFKGCVPHNGEYWYQCENCGKEDWIASYGTREELLQGRECKPEDKEKENRMNMRLETVSLITAVSNKSARLVETLANEVTDENRERIIAINAAVIHLHELLLEHSIKENGR